MKQQIYITDQEKENCQRVVAAFHDFFQQTDILVLDTGNYGFALLKYFNGDGFDCIETYISSNALFDALWQEWLKEKLIALCIHTPLIDLEYEKMFDGLSAKQQNEILEAKENFQFKIKNVHTNPDVTAPKTLSVSDPEKSRCETVANLFRKDLEKNDIILKEAGKYGFIMLEYFKPKSSFDCAYIFTDCQTMFHALLNEWYDCLITDLMLEKQVTNIDMDDFYDALPEEGKIQLQNRKQQFVKDALKKADFITAPQML